MTLKISQQALRLEKARRDKVQELMSDYDVNVHWPARKALVERCKAETGHNWRFRDLNPLGYPIFDCTFCRTTEIRPDE
jgi:hypothetical protein